MISCRELIVIRLLRQRYFENSIDQNGEPETITIDKSGSNLAALEAINAQRDKPIRIRQSKYPARVKVLVASVMQPKAV